MAWSHPKYRPWWLALLACVGSALTIRQVLHAASARAIDFLHVWHAAHQFLAGAGAYHDPLFTYPPSGALLVAPAGGLAYSLARECMLAVNVACVMAAGLMLMRQLRGRLDAGALVAVLGVGALDAVASTWANGNVNGILILLEVVALGQFVRGRWPVGAAALGLSLALKPVLLPMLALLVVRRQWRALLVAAGIPAMLLVIGCLTVPDAGRYLTVELPYLLHGAQLRYNDSLVGLAFRLGVSSPVVLIVRMALLALATGLYLRSTRLATTRLDGRSVIFVETGLVLSTTLLVSPMSEAYYTLFLLPSLLWWGMRGRGAGLAAAVVGVACFGTLRLTGVPGDVHHSWTLLAIRPTIGWIALFCVCAGILAKAGRGAPTANVSRHSREYAVMPVGAFVPSDRDSTRGVPLTAGDDAWETPVGPALTRAVATGKGRSATRGGSVS
jgi:arabinofuranan 3-O-arabinosyltransferase